MIKVTIKKGKELSASFIKKWNKTMFDEFEEGNPLNPKDKEQFSKHIFFIVMDRKNIVSIGRLVPVRINFLGKDYDIIGIADIVSVIKGKGYGKVLMTSMLKYLRKNKKTGIGFCESKNEIFYNKCGFKTEASSLKRFIYTDKRSKVHRDTDDDYVFYFDGKDKFMKKILSNKLNIDIPIHHW